MLGKKALDKKATIAGAMEKMDNMDLLYILAVCDIQPMVEGTWDERCQSQFTFAMEQVRLIMPGHPLPGMVCIDYMQLAKQELNNRREKEGSE